MAEKNLNFLKLALASLVIHLLRQERAVNCHFSFLVIQNTSQLQGCPAVFPHQILSVC